MLSSRKHRGHAKALGGWIQKLLGFVWPQAIYFGIECPNQVQPKEGSNLHKQ